MTSEEAGHQRAARQALQDARAYLIQDRAEAALRATTRGLLEVPDDAALLRERARALEALGRTAEAAEARTRADRLDPPPGQLPEGPLPGSFDDVLLVLQAPDRDFGSTRALHQARSSTDLEPDLRARLAVRLPGVLIVDERDTEPGSVPAAREWLRSHRRDRIAGLHILRALCGESVKDGRYAVATIHRTEATPTAADGPIRWSGASTGGEARTCTTAALHRALERWLAGPFFSSSASTGGSSSADGDPLALDRNTILALLPGLDARVQAQRTSARRALFVGDLERARTAFERAAVLDPEDDDLRAHIDEIEATLALNRELAQLEAARSRTAKSATNAAASEATEPPSGFLPAELTEAQKRALEAQLESERRRRDDLLATLATVSGSRHAAQVPSGALRDSELQDPDARGPRRALAALDHEQGSEPGPAAERLVVRTLHGPSGALVARYYFDARESTADAPPILIEEDVSGDGELDRWTSYAGGLRTALFEERRDESLPDLHAMYAEDGRTLVRLELDDGHDGAPDRVYEYEAGRLLRAAHDTNQDGRLDRFDRFDDAGRVVQREEDLTGDGRIDVRSSFVAGRLVKRELMAPDRAITP